MTLDQIAKQYADKTGCDDATANQAAFVVATLLADLVGNKDIGDYFASRATEMEEKIEFSGFSQPQVVVNTGYDDPQNWGQY